MWLGTEAARWLNECLTKDVVDAKSSESRRQTNWREFWLIPCGVVVFSLVLLLLLFTT